MIPLATDYAALLIDLLTEQIAGYYDPETKKLTISKAAGDDPSGPSWCSRTRSITALQDQAFDLEEVRGPARRPRAMRRSRGARSSRATASR